MNIKKYQCSTLILKLTILLLALTTKQKNDLLHKNIKKKNVKQCADLRDAPPLDLPDGRGDNERDRPLLLPKHQRKCVNFCGFI